VWAVNAPVITCVNAVCNYKWLWTYWRNPSQPMFIMKVVTTSDTPLPYRVRNGNSHFHGSLNHKPHNWTLEPINIDKEDEDVDVLSGIMTKYWCYWFWACCLHWTSQGRLTFKFSTTALHSYTGWLKSVCTWWLQYKNTQKYFKQFQSLTMIT
jgi:hypothetical protein